MFVLSVLGYCVTGDPRRVPNQLGYLISSINHQKAPPVVNTRLTKELVLALIPLLKDDPTVLRKVTDHIAREVKADVQGSSRMTWGEVEGSIAGLARTARVRVQSDLADALEKVTGVLERHIEKGEAAWEGDMPLKVCLLELHDVPHEADDRCPTCLSMSNFSYAFLRLTWTRADDLASDVESAKYQNARLSP